MQQPAVATTPAGLGAWFGRIPRAALAAVASFGLFGTPAAATPTVSVDGVEAVRLSNNIPLLLIPDPAKKPDVTVAVCYNKGSAIEGPGQQGAMHALEHMKFRRAGKWDVKEEQSNRQADGNGYTHLDRVCYYRSIPAGRGNALWELRFENDRARNTNYDSKGFKEEKTAFLSELNLTFDDPNFLLENAVANAAFGFSGYERSAIGNPKDVLDLEIPTIQALDKLVYQDPNNIVIAVSGQFDPKSVIDVAQETFGTMPQGTGTAPKNSVEPVQRGARAVQVLGSDPVARSQVAYHGVAAAHPLAVAQEALAQVLVDEGGPLHTALVKSGLVASLSQMPAIYSEPGLLTFYIIPTKPEQQERAERLLAGVVEGIATGKTTLPAEALDRWRRAKILDHDQTLSRRAMDLALKLAGSQVDRGDFRGWLSRRQSMEELTVGDLVQFAKDFLKSSNRTTGSYIPTKNVDLPKEATNDRRDFTVYQGAGTPKAEILPDTAAELERRTQSFELQNSAKVKLLPFKTEGNFVEGVITFRSADTNHLQGGPVPGVLGEMLKKGTASMNAVALRQKLAQLDASVEVSIATADPSLVQVTFSTRQQYLPKVIALTESMLREANFPKDQLAQVLTERSSVVDEQLGDGFSLARRAMDRGLQGEVGQDPRAVLSFQDEKQALSKITAEQLRNYWSQLQAAGQLSVTIAGAHDPEATKAALTASFGQWSAAPASALKPLEGSTRKQELLLDMPGKASAYVGVGAIVPIGEDHADWPALLVLRAMLGNFDGPAYDLLRHSGAGDTYSVASALRTEPNASSSVFYLLANSSTGKMVNAQKLLGGMFSKLVVTDRQVEVGKTELARTFQQTISSAGSLARAMANDLSRGRSLEFDEALVGKIQQLTTADIQRVIETYFRGPLLQLRVGDLQGQNS